MAEGGKVKEDSWREPVHLFRAVYPGTRSGIMMGEKGEKGGEEEEKGGEKNEEERRAEKRRNLRFNKGCLKAR